MGAALFGNVFGLLVEGCFQGGRLFVGGGRFGEGISKNIGKVELVAMGAWKKLSLKKRAPGGPSEMGKRLGGWNIKLRKDL